MRYLGKFISETEIQNALDNNELLNPYIALYNNGLSVDINTKENKTKIFLKLSTSINSIEYTTSETVGQAHGGGASYNLNYIEITGIPNEIKSYLLGYNYNRWYHLQTPINFINNDGNDHINIWPQYTYPINVIKYDNNTNILYLSSNRFIWNDIRYDDVVHEEDSVENVFKWTEDKYIGHTYSTYDNYYTGYKLYFDNIKNKFILEPVIITSIETYINTDDKLPLVYEYDGYNTSDLNIFFIPSFLINKIEDYQNNIWDGSSIDITEYNIYLYNNSNSFGNSDETTYPYPGGYLNDNGYHSSWSPEEYSGPFDEMLIENGCLVLKQSTYFKTEINLNTLKLSYSGSSC